LQQNLRYLARLFQAKLLQYFCGKGATESMVSLTVQQKNLLDLLLASDTPVAIAQLADQTNLSPRQVNYRLKPVRQWLSRYEIELKATPGIGVTLDCSPDQRQYLRRELNSQSDFRLILTADQRQQLFAINLLTASEPIILNWFQYNADVSRTTVIKDLDTIEGWTKKFEVALVRRPNYGIEFEGDELALRQALAALLWGDFASDKPLAEMSHGAGLTFLLDGTDSLLPILQTTSRRFKDWNTKAAFNWVALAETQLGGRFTDNAVLHLALSLAIQVQRVANQRFVSVAPETLTWLQSQQVWRVAAGVARTIRETGLLDHPLVTEEIAAIAMQLLSGMRDHMWPGDLEIDATLTNLVDELMTEVAMAFATPGLRNDTPLRDGLVAHIIPALMSQRFGLWSPRPWPDETLARHYHREHQIAHELARLVTKRTGVVLPDGEINILAFLLRAAFIRESANRPKRVLIICPSGMATAQLLVARLKARFPGLDVAGVLSIRELTARSVANAHLLVSTVPVQSPRSGLTVIQVHPLLLPEDIDKITQWLA
jgi:mannitol operon transcriptional antiterminator